MREFFEEGPGMLVRSIDFCCVPPVDFMVLGTRCYMWKLGSAIRPLSSVTSLLFANCLLLPEATNGYVMLF